MASSDSGGGTHELGPLIVFLSGHSGSGKTAAAALLAMMIDDVEIIEVDVIKKKRYGTTEKCCPSKDFPEAGRLAASALADGKIPAVVEAFGDEDHVRYVLNELPQEVNDVHIMLACDLEDAIERKRGTLPADVVRNQFTRFGRKFPTRRRIDTSTCSPDEVAGSIRKLIESSKP